MTVGGMRPLKPAEPVCNLSYYEAETFATWVGARLPTESEWDHAAATLPVQGRFVEDGWLHPRPAPETTGGLRQMFGDLWEWTGFAYLPYPGYRPPEGALGEYNGKFMCNQMVLRGGSCATSADHIRVSYRNFFSSRSAGSSWGCAWLGISADRRPSRTSGTAGRNEYRPLVSPTSTIRPGILPFLGHSGPRR